MSSCGCKFDWIGTWCCDTWVIGEDDIEAAAILETNGRKQRRRSPAGSEQQHKYCLTETSRRPPTTLFVPDKYFRAFLVHSRYHAPELASLDAATVEV